MTSNRVLARLSTAEIEYLNIDDIIASSDDLQKRRPDAVTGKVRANYDSERARLIKDIRATLEDDPAIHSTPVKVVRCVPDDDGDGFGPENEELNYLVDGFHRMAAYIQAGRKTIPVQRVTGTWAEAHEAATAMNIHTRTVGVDKAERLQQAWELVNRYLDREDSKLAKGWSARQISRATGVVPQTVNNMVNKSKALGRAASSKSWKEAKSSADREEIDERKRMLYLVRQTLEFADTTRGSDELDLMIRVLADHRDDKLGYQPDLEDYVDKLLGEGDEGF